MSGNDILLGPDGNGEGRWFVDGVDVDDVDIGEEHWWFICAPDDEGKYFAATIMNAHQLATDSAMSKRLKLTVFLDGWNVWPGYVDRTWMDIPSPLSEHIRPCALNSSEAARAGKAVRNIATTESWAGHESWSDIICCCIWDYGLWLYLGVVNEVWLRDVGHWSHWLNNINLDWNIPLLKYTLYY